MEYGQAVMGPLILIVLSSIVAADLYNHKGLGEKQGIQEQQQSVGWRTIEADVRKGLLRPGAVNSAEQTHVLVSVTTATDNDVVIKVSTVQAQKKILDPEDKFIDMDPPRTGDSSWQPSFRLSFVLGLILAFCLILRRMEEHGP